MNNIYFELDQFLEENIIDFNENEYPINNDKLEILKSKYNSYQEIEVLPINFKFKLLLITLSPDFLSNRNLKRTNINKMYDHFVIHQDEDYINNLLATCLNIKSKNLTPKKSSNIIFYLIFVVIIYFVYNISKPFLSEFDFKNKSSESNKIEQTLIIDKNYIKSCFDELKNEDRIKCLDNKDYCYYKVSKTELISYETKHRIPEYQNLFKEIVSFEKLRNGNLLFQCMTNSNDKNKVSEINFNNKVNELFSNDVKNCYTNNYALLLNKDSFYGYQKKELLGKVQMVEQTEKEYKLGYILLNCLEQNHESLEGK